MRFYVYYRDVPKKKEMENAVNMVNGSLPGILQSLGLSTLIERFERERIDHEMINTLSDGELTRLGVATIGDRHRLRRRCTEETEKQQVNKILF